MPRARARLLLAAVGATALGLAALPAEAGTAPTKLVITDETGDNQVEPLGAGDIASVTYTTTGTTTTKRVGRKTVRTYTPTALVVTLKTADAIDTSGTTTYEVDSDLAGCDSGFDLYYTPGVDGSEGGGCLNGSGTDITSEGVDGPPVVGASSITWTIPFKAVSGALRAGAGISGIHAYTGLVEPVTGIVGPYLVDSALANDEVTSDALYKIG